MVGGDCGRCWVGVMGCFGSGIRGTAVCGFMDQPRTAANLEVELLVGKPVALPVTAVTVSIGEFKAHIYGAWHSGRKTNNPISRKVQESITGISERTQRHYCVVAKIKRQTNIAIGNKYTQEEVQNQAWQRGRATFQFTDYQGRHGRKGTSYVAWHLPNSYTCPHQQTAKGRMRKINRKLKDLVNVRAQGNKQLKVVKLYHANGAKAARVFNRDVRTDIYWPVRSKEKKAFQFWSVLSS